jgi:SAM-dependent methyltransferase
MQDKAIALGHPSYVWGFGQERRLNLIRRFVVLEGSSILDIGCGLGMYVRAMSQFSDDVHGVDVDLEKVQEASQDLPNIRQAPAEDLPFPGGALDVVLSHEVIEHVDDDRQAIAEAVRVLKPGGRLVVFAPNRLYPFETHGAYWAGEYHYGNIPLVNYLPNPWRNRFCPHVRAYTVAGLRRLWQDLPVRLVIHTQIYPGYDKIVRSLPTFGRVLRQATYLMEKTPFRFFGLSHFVVLEKTVRRVIPPG